jgi:hypothetical protein
MESKHPAARFLRLPAAKPLALPILSCVAPWRKKVPRSNLPAPMAWRYVSRWGIQHPGRFDRNADPAMPSQFQQHLDLRGGVLKSTT